MQEDLKAWDSIPAAGKEHLDLLDVVGVEVLTDYRLLLAFENGEKRIFDARPYLHRGVFGRRQAAWPGERQSS